MIRFHVTLCGCIAVAPCLVGAEPPTSPSPASKLSSTEPAPHLIVVRVSPDLIRFRNRERTEVNEEAPVREVVLGTPVVGTARVRGEVSIDFFPNREDAGLWLTFSGTSVARTVSNHRPAIIQSVVSTQFMARKPITFDLERGFRYGGAGGDVQVLSTQRTVKPTVGGLRGRIVRRIAHRRLARLSGYLDDVAEQNTQRRIEASFDREAEQRIATLNLAIGTLRQVLQRQVAVQREGRYEVKLNTTDRYLQIGIGPKGAANPRLPDEGIAPLPVQVWFHQSLFGDQPAALLGTWGNFRDALPTPANTSGLMTLLKTPQQTRDSVPIEFATARPWLVIAVGRERIRDARRAEASRRAY